MAFRLLHVCYVAHWRHSSSFGPGASFFSPHYCMIEDTVRTKLEDGYQEHAIASFCLLGQ